MRVGKLDFCCIIKVMRYSSALSISAVFAILALFAVAVYFFSSTSNPFVSVELGLAELSPNGESGGFAVPASGGSNPSTFNYSCADTGESVTLTWSASSDIYGHSGAVTYGLRLDDQVNSWNGACNGGELPNDYCVDGLSGLSQSVDVIQGHPYHGWVQACSGDTCGSGSNTDFTCYATLPPTANLEVQNTTTGGDWTGNNITINVGEEIALQWTSDYTISCSGDNFSTGGDTDSSESDVSEPVLFDTIQYTLSCTGGGGTVFDWLAVYADGDPPTITGDPKVVTSGSDSTISWNTNDALPENCSVSGPRLNESPLTSVTGSEVVTVTRESTYTIDCGISGTAEVIIQVLPTIQET